MTVTVYFVTSRPPTLFASNSLEHVIVCEITVSHDFQLPDYNHKKSFVSLIYAYLCNPMCFYFLNVLYNYVHRGSTGPAEHLLRTTPAKYGRR